MRRLVGLIALAALIYAAVWMIQNDFDLRKIPILSDVIKEIETPTSQSVPDEAPAEAAATLASQAPSDASENNGTDASAASESPPVSDDGSSTETLASDMSEAAVSASSNPDGQPSETEIGDVPDAEQPTGEAAAEVEITMIEPGGDSAAGRTPSGNVPTFDIVRVEPSGETVIAGVAAPQAKVEVLNGEQPVATAEANERGEWALVLEVPLPPGTHDLSIRSTSEDGSEVTHSDQRVAISMPEAKEEEPLVVLNQPDTPSRIIQIPSDGGDAQQVAAGPQPQTGTGQEQSESMSATAGSSTETTTDVAAAPREDQMQAPADESAAADQSVAAQAEAESDMAASAQPETADAGATAVGQSAETAQPSVGTEQMAGDAPSSAASSTKEMATAPASPGDSAAETTTAAAEPSQPSTPEKTETPPADAAPPPAMSEVTEAPATPEVAEPPPVTPEVGVAAVEAETDGTLYIAGTATTREPVRVYIDEVLVGETTPTEGGTWLLETEREMPPAEYTIRADQIEAGSGDVVARAEVPFRREIEVASLSVAGESTGSGTAEVAGRISDPAKVVIKRGDNLWRISRSLYGRGIRYSTIYKANQDQIRDPDLIYPGQVFVMPTGDTAWDSQQ